MVVFDFTGQPVNRTESLPGGRDAAELFVVCRAREMRDVLRAFGWDARTAAESTNLDEAVRHASYDGYDFVSLIYAEREDGLVVQEEVNLFLTKRHLVLVLPDRAGARLERLAEGLCEAATTAAVRHTPLTSLYALFFNHLAADFSETLEQLEDEIEALAERIAQRPCHEQIAEIGRLRKAAYTCKKLLRALSYSGEQILVDENQLLDKGHARYFRAINTRLMKQYDFAESLYDLCGDLLHTYDSKASAQLNETVNKFTAITLIFGPLTIIAGIYGMNFAHMPELHWVFGYPLSLGVMAVVGLGIFFLMKKKKWL